MPKLPPVQITQKQANQITQHLYIFWLVRTATTRSSYTPLDCLVMAYIQVYGYSKSTIKRITIYRGQTSDQSVRNSVSKLIKSGDLTRNGYNNVEVNA